MGRNTIQIQHKKFRISNLQKFDLTGFCLPYFNRSTVCWTRVRPIPELLAFNGPLWFTAFSSITSGSPIVGLQMSCMFKIEGRQSIKSIEIYWSEITALGCSQAQSLTKNQPRNTFLQSLYSMHRRVSASHWLRIRPGLLQSAPTSFVLCPDAASAFLQK